MKYIKVINGNLSKIKINNYLIIISIKFTSLIILFCVVQLQSLNETLQPVFTRQAVPLYINGIISIIINSSIIEPSQIIKMTKAIIAWICI
jgi:hypothetical protein